MKSLDDVASVQAISLPKDYWRYEAVLHDGTTVPLRNRATRLYKYAIMYGEPVGPGCGLAEFFLYTSTEQMRDYHGCKASWRFLIHKAGDPQF